jgi:hypothetical protein
VSIEYLAAASGVLGPIAEHHISQRGEPIARFERSFQRLDETPRTNMRE